MSKAVRSCNLWAQFGLGDSIVALNRKCGMEWNVMGWWCLSSYAEFFRIERECDGVR